MSPQGPGGLQSQTSRVLRIIRIPTSINCERAENLRSATAPKCSQFSLIVLPKRPSRQHLSGFCMILHETARAWNAVPSFLRSPKIPILRWPLVSKSFQALFGQSLRSNRTAAASFRIRLSFAHHRDANYRATRTNEAGRRPGHGTETNCPVGMSGGIPN